MSDRGDGCQSAQLGQAVLVVAGGAKEAAGLAGRLAGLGFPSIASAYDDEQLTHHLSGHGISLIVLELDGLAEPQGALRAIRNFTSLPLVVLGPADWPEEDIVWYLEHGADDCVRGPYEPVVLAAQLRAVLRHASGSKRDYASP